MKPRCLGDYEIGYESVSLYTRDGYGAELVYQRDDANCPVICIGMDADDWWQIVARLLHEALELTFLRKGCRFCPSGDLSADTGAYHFFCDHYAFSSCCADVADFLVRALPDLEKAWKARKK